MSTRSTDPRPGSFGDTRYTLLVIPESGRGSIWQRSIPLRRVHAVLAAGSLVTVLLVGLSLLHLLTWRRVIEHDRLVGENLELRTRLEGMETRLAELGPLLQRVRAYDDRLRELAGRGALPGFGPLDAEEMAAREAWIQGVLPDLPAPSDPKGADAMARTLARLSGQLSDAEAELDVLEDHMSEAESLLARWEDARAVLPQIWPLESYTLSSPFGWRRSPYGRRVWKFHSGLDLAADRGEPIYAVAPGLVVFAGWDAGYGRCVVIDHGHGVETRYGHASSLLVLEGDVVDAGDLVALVGSSGQSTGPHLHLELMFEGERVDPLPYLP